MTATITSKGQITIPAKIREELGLVPGTVLKFENSSGFLKAKKVIDEKRMRSVLGCCRDTMKGMTWERWVEQTRGRKMLTRDAHRGR